MDAPRGIQDMCRSYQKLPPSAGCRPLPHQTNAIVCSMSVPFLGFQVLITGAAMQVLKVGAMFQSANITVLAWLHLLLLDLYQARQAAMTDS